MQILLVCHILHPESKPQVLTLTLLCHILQVQRPVLAIAEAVEYCFLCNNLLQFPLPPRQPKESNKNHQSELLSHTFLLPFPLFLVNQPYLMFTRETIQVVKG